MNMREPITGCVLTDRLTSSRNAMTTKPNRIAL